LNPESVMIALAIIHPSSAAGPRLLSAAKDAAQTGLAAMGSFQTRKNQFSDSFSGPDFSTIYA
jgi:hypothetical protein